MKITTIYKSNEKNVNSKKYDLSYSNAQATKENETIKNILKEYIPKGSVVTDIGCGTGLLLDIMGDDYYKYIGVDNDEEMIEKCVRKHQKISNRFIVKDGYEFVKISNYIENPVLLFSLDYVNPEVIELLKEKSIGPIIMIHYNKPYMEGSTSEYLRKKEYFYKLHSYNQEIIKQKLINNNFDVSSLQGEPYYYVSILDNN